MSDAESPVPFDAPLPTDGRILFCRRDRVAFGFLSNFHPAPILLDGRVWPTTEHFYQSQKSSSVEYQAAILAAATPGRAKRLGTLPTLPRKQSRMSWFRRHDLPWRDDWFDVRLEVMRQALIAKFTQNEDLRARLQATAGVELVEDSAQDEFWGIGAVGCGENWLGRLLMQTRSTVANRGEERAQPG